MPFDPASGAYVDMRVARGFPLGGMGSGGIALNTDGSFGELRLNNNWMCPIRGPAGSFHACFAERDGAPSETVLLRMAPGADVPGAPAWREYEGVRHVRSTTFVGTLPTFRLRYDDTLPVERHARRVHPARPPRRPRLDAAGRRLSLPSRESRRRSGRCGAALFVRERPRTRRHRPSRRRARCRRRAPRRARTARVRRHRRQPPAEGRDRGPPRRPLPHRSAPWPALAPRRRDG